MCFQRIYNKERARVLYKIIFYFSKIKMRIFLKNPETIPETFPRPSREKAYFLFVMLPLLLFS